MPSSTLPDEQDPQSPTPAIITSHVVRMSATVASSTGTLAFRFRHTRVSDAEREGRRAVERCRGHGALPPLRGGAPEAHGVQRMALLHSVGQLATMQSS